MRWEERMLPITGTGLPLLVLLLSTGCAVPTNPSFAVTVPEARAALKQMEAAPKVLPRPVVVLGGYQDAGLGTLVWRGEVRRWAKDVRVVDVSFMTARDFEQCRREVIAAV